MHVPASPGTEPTTSLAELLGGRRAGLEVAAPAVAFVVVWQLTGGSVGWASAVAVGVAVALAAYRRARGHRPRAVLVGLLGVALAALVVLRTGRAEDFFLVRLASNAASALAWATSIVVRWPLLGIVVGTLLGQRTRWRRDPALLRAYGRASWVWAGQYVVRVVVFGSLWSAGAVAALGVASAVLTWPLVALCIAVSGWVFQRTLPDDHPGLRHPTP